MKFLSQINVNTRYTLPMVDGTNGQVLSTDGNGVAYWGTISVGSLTLDGLSDVSIVSPSSDQILRYGLRQGDTVPVWHNFTPNFLTPSSSIDSLGDVSITTAATGQLLRYNGSAWVNWTPNFLTAEADTLATVTARGATTNGNIVINGEATIQNSGYLRLIAGSSEMSGFTVFNSAQNGYLSNRITTSAHSRGWGWEFTTNEANNNAGNVYFRVGYNGAISYLNSGNFGIGTDNPLAKLDVVGHTYIRGGQLYVDTIAGYSVGVVSLAGSTNFIVPSGNIGIRTTTPQKFLDVNGSGIVASFGGSISTGSFAGVHFGYSESYLNNDNYKKSAIVFERTDNHGQGGNASGKIHFLLNNIGSASATSLAHSVMVIDTNSTATQGSARVGIGTTSPNSTLDVNGAANATSFSSTALLITNADTSGSLTPNQGDPANKIYSFRWQGNEGGYIDTDNKITFSGFKTPAGTSSQFLKANGTVDSSTYLTSTALNGYATETWVNANFYNEGEIDDFFSGAEAITGYNKSNWDAAYNDKINSASFSTTTGVLTLTQQDTGTVTVDLDGRFYLDTNPSGYISGISFANVSAKPTTIAGYGITDAITTANIANQSVNSAAFSRYVIDTPSTRITTPEGASSVNNSSGTSGAIRIQLPTTVYNNNTMVSMTVEVYLYSTGQSFTLRIGGYNYFDGTWYNVFASLLSDSGKSLNVPVYFGNNGVDRNVIWIGDSNSSWEYPNVFVTDVQVGHSQNSAWAKGWSVSFSEAEQTNVTASRIAYRQVDAGNIGSYALTSLPAHTHTIANVTGLQTALDGKLSSDSDSEQDVGGRYFRFNNGLNRINIDPRWNESGYDADLGVFHMYSTTSAGVQWGRTGIALFSGSAYQYLTTKSGTTGIFLNNQEIIHSGNIGSQSVTYATSAGTANNLIGLGSIQSTSTGTSYQNNYQVRENSGGGGNTNEIYAPQLAFHWSGVVASSIMMEASGRIAIRNNPGGSYENFAAAVITATGGNSTEWNTAYNDKINSASFNTTTGVLTLTQQDTGTVTVDLDGRYLESLPAHTHAASDITSGTLSTDRLPKQELGISIVGNFGQWQPHSAYTNFNTDVAYWGWNYVQGSTNAPHQISSQWYRGRFSLGDEYGFGASSGDYWMEIAIPRYNQSSTSGNLFVRTCENGGINAWQGVRAAYATDAASAAYAEESGYSASSGSVEWTNVQSKPATFPPSAHNHDDRYYTETESDSRFYLATNPSGYITGYTETDTLSSVTGRGGSTGSPVVMYGKVTLGNNSSGTYSGNTTGLTLNSTAEVRSTGVQNPPALTWHYEGLATRHLLMTSAGAFNFVSPSNEASGVAVVQVNGNTVWHAGNLTNLNQLTNGPGYITGYTETDTLDTVLARGTSTTRTAEFYQTSNTFVNTVAAGNRGLTVFQNTAGADAYITFHISNDYAGYFGLGGAENDLVWGGWSVGNARHRILHSGNFTDNSANWNTAYNDRISSASVTGTTTKTLTLTQGDGGTVTATWTDYDTDNDAQQLTYDSGANQLSISGGNSITLTGLATQEFVTSQGYVTGSYLPLTGGTLSGNLTFSTQGSKITFGDSTSNNPCMIGEGLVNTEGTDSDFLTIYARSSLRIYSTVTTERARFDINGLTVNGTITEQSSIRYKKDVVGIESISDRVELLKPVRYKKIENDAEEIGLIAEDVVELFPEVVKYDNEGRPDGINYSRLSVILLKAVQELTERVNKLENK